MGDFVIMAADQQCVFSIIKMKDDYDKIWEVEGKLFGAQGPSSDAANFARNQLAQALRKGSYQVDLLIAGVDEDGPQLYFMDYLASCEKVNKGAQGYGAMFTFGLMDRYYKEDMNLDEAKDLIRMCIKELETRFLVDLGTYMCKVVDKNGTRIEAL